MNKLFILVQHIKFRLTIITLLCGATLISLTLFRIRTMLSDSLDYSFLIWNIFLAWIPLGLAHTATTFSLKKKSILVGLPIAAILWLIFFPNAPYILTDLQHLGIPKNGIPVWYDVLLLLWFAWTGLLLGMLSLFLMQEIVRREFGHLASWLFVICAGFLGSLGIYIGRFLRWNSWDILINPFARLTDFLYYATHPSMQSIIFISTISSFFIFFYLSLFAFGLLLHEQTNPFHKETP